MEIVAKFTGPRNRAVVIASVLLVVTCVIWLVIFLQLHSQPRNSVAAAGAKLSSTVDPNSANRRFRRAGASLSVGKGHCQHGSWKFATGYGAKLEDMERKLVEVEKQVLANTQAESDSDVVVSQSDQEKLFEEEVLNEGIRMPTIEAEWEPAPHCVHEVYSAEKAMQCMAQKRRIVWLGDSVLRGMFWDIVEFFQNGLSNSKFEVRVDKRYASERFTNFEDEDLIVTDKQTNDEVFSLRFTYVSNAVEFESRCELIHDWFFQCLDDTRTIMDRVIEEELGRKQLKTNAPDDLPIGLLYWNTGLWDWRTGLPTHEYYEAMKSILLNVDPTEEQAKAGWTGYKRASIFDHSREVVWRANTASWPTKFASANECLLKPNPDPRPCKIHTNGLLEYNMAVHDLMAEAGFSIVDPWEATASRPDASIDGLHFEECNPQVRNMSSFDKDRGCINRVVNQMFFNTICSS